MADCPDCSVPLSNPASCVCGWKKSGKGGYTSGAKVCQFQTNGVNCQMSADSNDGGRWYCGWHQRCVVNPALIRDFTKFTKFHEGRIDDEFDEKMKKVGLPLPANPWRGSVLQLWKRVGGEHGSNYAGDRMQASAGSEKSPEDYLNAAKRSLGRSGREKS